MKKLSELVAYKNELDCLGSESAQTFLNLELGKITHLVKDAELEQQLNNLNQIFVQFNLRVNQLKQDLQDQISTAEMPWIQEGYNLYDKGEVDYVDNILDSRKDNSITSSLFISKLNQYANWRYPAMIIRPGKEELVHHMVAFDPLYLVDLSYEFLEPAMKKFNEKYQNRLRQYVVKEDLDSGILNKLPNNQFGLCLAYNYFNFRPIEIIKKYLEEIYQKLRPGGIFMFTFNDCDRRSAVELVESYYCCYTPGHLMKELISTVGYTISDSWHDDGPTTWIEIQKPGKLTSLKSGPTMAKILPK